MLLACKPQHIGSDAGVVLCFVFATTQAELFTPRGSLSWVGDVLDMLGQVGCYLCVCWAWLLLHSARHDAAQRDTALVSSQNPDRGVSPCEARHMSLCFVDVSRLALAITTPSL